MSSSDKEKVSGIVEEIIYQNDDNGYTICDIEDENGYLVTLCGNMPYLNAGDSITAIGKWTVHPTYGRQFSVDAYDRTMPEGTDAILKYLESGTVKGIGPKTARKIIKEFGDDTLDILENHPDWLSQIPGISLKKAEEISENFIKTSGSRNLMMFCSEYIGAGNTMKVYKQWGGEAVNKIKSNPYLLCNPELGISFNSADKLAQSCGFEEDAPERIDAAIIHILNHVAGIEGHTCLPEERLITETAKKIGVDSSKILERIIFLCKSNILIPVENETKYYYLEKYRKAELYVAEKLNLLIRKCPRINNNDIVPFISKAERYSGLSYAEKQKIALGKSMENGILILTGGPGTGKTTIIKGLISIFESMDFKIALAAPTGRAAKRMSEATGNNSKTIHRLLEMELGGEIREARFKRNEEYYLDENIIIIDEFSMVDILLFEALLKAIKPGSRLILIGDKDQLPSVGAGNVLSDLLDTELIPSVELKEIFRQSEDSKIILNAHLINDGIVPEIDNKSKDFFFMERNTDREVANTLNDLIKNRLPKAYGNEIIEKIQIISPSRKGEAGTVNLNSILQTSINPPADYKNELISGSNVFRVGDKVMQNKNNYDVEWIKEGIEGYGIFNGDIGIIIDIDNEEKIITIDFDSRVAKYDFSMMEEIELAYAITVHKSQGSEYPIIIIPLYNCPPMLRTRHLLYTAVTRAEKMVILVGRKNILEQMVLNNRHVVRFTEFKSLLESKH